MNHQPFLPVIEGDQGLTRGYQYGYSERTNGMFDVTMRENKARTMVAVLEAELTQPLTDLCLLNIGGSSGIIDNYLADYFKHIESIDIDEHAQKFAKHHFHRSNLNFQIGDATKIDFPSATFDVVICSQVYEHVDSPEAMMGEILRVLKPGGYCYFAASNRLRWSEPHYHLPLLSAIPRPLAHIYVKLAGKAAHYHEKHYSFWGLKQLANNFVLHDYTREIINDPARFHLEYLIPIGSKKQKLARFVARFIYWLAPGYIWLLQKPLSKPAN